MTEKISQEDVQELFAHFCKVTGRPTPDPLDKSDSMIGKWLLIPGHYFQTMYVIAVIIEGGEHRFPFGHQRRNAAEMWDVLQFAIKSHEEHLARYRPSWIIAADPASKPVTLNAQPLYDEIDRSAKKGPYLDQKALAEISNMIDEVGKRVQKNVTEILDRSERHANECGERLPPGWVNCRTPPPPASACNVKGCETGLKCTWNDVRRPCPLHNRNDEHHFDGSDLCT